MGHQTKTLKDNLYIISEKTIKFNLDSLNKY